jgi:hypothetical protein
MKHVSDRGISRILFAGILAVVVAAPLRAQDVALDQRWQPWLGCWQQPASETVVDFPQLCVIPTGGSAGVTMISLENGKEPSRQQLDATGQQRAVERDGCAGWESAQFSADDRRLYLRSELTCSGNLKRASSAVLAMSPEGDWIGVESVTAGGGTAVRVTRYRDAGIPNVVPAEIENALAGRRMALVAARIAAGAPIGEAAVIDATHHLNAAVVQALLVERGQPFQLTASQLASLADAGVPGSVTDVMVALSYPQKFVLDRDARVAELRPTSGGADTYGRGMLPGYDGRSACSLFSSYDPYWYGYGYGYGSQCGLYANSRYGYSNYGYGSFGYGYWQPPIVIVREGSRPGGRAVKGSGYTPRGESSGTATRTGVSRPSSSGGGATARSSGSSGGSSSGRTAHRKP